MGGIPWWAALIGTPIAAGKMANGVTETVDSLNKVNDMMDNRADRKQYAADLSTFSSDKSFLPKSTAYRNPETAMKVIQDFQKQAAPALMDQFKTNYETITGTSDPRFFGDAESRGELAKSGLDVPTGNPMLSTSLADFQKEGAQRQTLKAALEGDPLALASVGADKDLASSFHLAQQGFDIPAKRELDTQDKARKQQREDFAEKQKLDAEAQQAEFDRMAAGIGGRYQDAQPKQFNEGADGALQQVPVTAPKGKQPNVWNDGFNYVDGKGDVTPRRIMPFDEARRTLMELAAAYPKANTKEAFNGLRSQYREAYSNADYVPSATNWMGEATNDKNQLQLAANSGDPDAQRIIAAQDARELKQSQGKREIIVNNPLPAKMDMNPLSAEEQTALSNAIAERRLDPYKVNSKNQKLLAGAALSHPGVDLNTIAAELGLARNTGVQMKAATAEMLPGLVQKTVEAGKALGYSDAKFVGIVQKWQQGQFNDPKLTKYMTLRNDQLLTIGGVMRSNGMTDMAQKLEEEAMHPTLSPKALDSWMEGQLESIDPRLNFYRNATKGNKAIPRANYTPKPATGYGTSSGAAIAPAGTKVARKGGGFYTSDGKGGWY